MVLTPTRVIQKFVFSMQLNVFSICIKGSFFVFDLPTKNENMLNMMQSIFKVSLGEEKNDN